MVQWEEEIEEYKEDRVRLINDYDGMFNRQYEGLRELHKKREMKLEEEIKQLQDEMERRSQETIVIIDSDEENEDCDVSVPKLRKEHEALLAELARMKEKNEMLELQLQEVPVAEHAVDMLTALTNVTITILFSNVCLLGTIL